MDQYRPPRRHTRWRGARIAAEIADFIGGVCTGNSGTPGAIQAHGHGRHLQASIALPGRVSGRSETKTYGKSAVVRECDGAENFPKKKLLRERYGCKITCFPCIARSSRSHRGTLFGQVGAHRYRETV